LESAADRLGQGLQIGKRLPREPLWSTVTGFAQCPEVEAFGSCGQQNVFKAGWKTNGCWLRWDLSRGFVKPTGSGWAGCLLRKRIQAILALEEEFVEAVETILEEVERRAAQTDSGHTGSGSEGKRSGADERAIV